MQKADMQKGLLIYGKRSVVSLIKATFSQKLESCRELSMQTYKGRVFYAVGAAGTVTWDRTCMAQFKFPPPASVILMQIV